MRESAAALRAFSDYLAQPVPRSLERLGQEYRSRSGSVPTRQVSRLKFWSQQHGWQERCRAHDEAVAAEDAERLRRERLADLEQRRAERLQVARGMRKKAVAALAEMTVEELSHKPYAVVQMLAHADGAERLDFGEATSRTEIDAGAQLLAALDRVLATPVVIEVPEGFDPFADAEL